MTRDLQPKGFKGDKNEKLFHVISCKFGLRSDIFTSKSFKVLKRA